MSYSDKVSIEDLQRELDSMSREEFLALARKAGYLENSTSGESTQIKTSVSYDPSDSACPATFSLESGDWKLSKVA